MHNSDILVCTQAEGRVCALVQILLNWQVKCTVSYIAVYFISWFVVLWIYVWMIFL